MKLLVFAHVPPPYHGQSAAVQQMLKHFGGNRRKSKFRREPPNHYGIECYHVNARLSKTLEDVGEFQFRKFDQILFYCLQAIWCRFRYGVKTLYYVPAPGKTVALYRDWLVMFFCRPFFERIIFHWHGSGLAKWLETSVKHNTRTVTYRLMGNADLSIALSEAGRCDPEKLLPRRIVVVPGGVSDPCPGFAETLLAGRRTRATTLKGILFHGIQLSDESEKIVNVLSIGHCTREKGVFDSVEAIALANEKNVSQNLSLRFRLTLIGAFISMAEEKELREFIRQKNLQNAVAVLGFVTEEQKKEELRKADIFCFPSYFPAEGQPASLIEALAFGLPIVTTRWRGIPAMLPEDYPGLVDIKSPAQIAEKLLFLCASDLGGHSRDTFLRRFTLERHLAAISQALQSVENAAS
jgi:glycosyltransferase involved in cell wall biosynthesis